MVMRPFGVAQRNALKVNICRHRPTIEMEYGGCQTDMY